MATIAKSPPHVVVVDDDDELRELLELRLKFHGYRVSTRRSASDALRVLEQDLVDALLVDLRLERESGLDVLAYAQRRVDAVPVLILTAHGSIDLAVEATRNGAYAFLTKPFDDRELLERLGNAVDYARRGRAVADLRASEVELAGTQLVGECTRMREVRATISRIASTDATVLILGESGTGKEVAARSLHALSGRPGRIVALNCAALPPELLESELFGHRRGAFTGAIRDKEGLIAAAEGGTLFLDEIGDAPASVQVKLLRVLQDRTYVPLGALEPKAADVRIIAATNRDLRADMRAGRFREDLFYRLHVMPLTMPPLRERHEDIPLLAELFLARAVEQHRLPKLRIASDALTLLLHHDWPGNVRELGNVVESAALLCNEATLGAQQLARALPASQRSAGEPAAPGGARGVSLAEAPLSELSQVFTDAEPILPMRDARNLFDRAYLVHILRRASGNISAAARLSGRNRTDLYELLRRYDLNPTHFRS